jgi:bisphosphoglycerate-independent phosphoglycerate mutase (AlkP superfamily)
LIGKSVTLTAGILADVAPTVLKLLGIDAPSSMTGHNLLDSQFDL